ncbi:LysR family transcriptional regulator [Saezia sanguinis]|uniref:LysR family transcriptional regulator n=1 Tax=Saezia sanguinis TaxID=1965230 RepID=UPI00304B9487
MDRVTAARVFVEIVERGGLSPAAASLEMSRPMVTRYLAAMEHWAGTRLLHRTTRQISLTEAGSQALQDCRQLLDVAQRFPIASARSVQGLIRVSCAHVFAQYILAPALSRFLAQYPQVTVDLQVSDQAVNLVANRIDLAIRSTNHPDPQLVARPLGQCVSVLCAAPAYLEKHGLPKQVEDLMVHNCLTHHYYSKSLWAFQARKNQPPKSVPVNGSMSASESTVLLAAALQGAGITMQPVFAVLPYLQTGQLVEVLGHEHVQDLAIYGLYASHQGMTPLLRTLLDFLVHWFSQQDPAGGIRPFHQ